MSKKKGKRKSGKKDMSVEKLILITAVLNLIHIAIEIIKDLMN